MIISNGTESFAGVDFDDIVIHSTRWRENLVEVFGQFNLAGLTIKQKKCTFAATWIGSGGVS